MVPFKKHTLSNGLRVIVHRDETTPMAAVNVLYDVGARDEDPGRTGFAHLFEHLMFEGSVNIPHYDRALQLAGGENNAFTTNDITNYYLTLPVQNLEVGFWLESDRMLGLDFSERKLALQQDVVTEEYRQSYLNRPYGDAWLLLRPLAYDVHPYRWATIGKNIEHIRDACIDEVKGFFQTFYHPSNAILSVTGHVDHEKVFRLAEKWFGGIPGRETHLRKLPCEPSQKNAKRLVVERDVPQDLLLMVFHMEGRHHPDYFSTDLLSDILANGESARLNSKLVHQHKLFSELNAYISGSIDPGLIVIQGYPHPDVGVNEAEDALWNEVQYLMEEKVSDHELQKVKNRVESMHVMGESSVLAKAMNLAFYELLGDANLLNKQMEAYAGVQVSDIQRVAAKLFRPQNSAVLRYLARESSGATSLI